jgi:hypothetical protein
MPVAGKPDGTTSGVAAWVTAIGSKGNNIHAIAIATAIVTVTPAANSIRLIRFVIVPSLNVFPIVRDFPARVKPFY